MKKYKHKTSGIIAEENNHFMCYTIKHERLAESLIDRKIIENSNDWEEVKEEPFIQQYGRVDRVKDPIETIISDKYPIKNMIKAKTYETLAQKLFTSSIIYTATDGISIREGSKTTLYLLNKDDLSIVKPFYKVDIFNFSKQDEEVASRYLTFTSEENRDKYIKENTKKPIFVSADGVEMFEGDYYYVPQTDFNDNLKGTFLKLTVLNQKYSDNTARFSSPELAQEYIDNNKPKFSFADIFTASEKIPSEYLTTTGLLDELKKLGK
jgi:hypothetical protein